ncbi:MAG TPA: serine/threonine-protein kinase [Gemmataceae bacterium]|nr:serine/threonine-protein kinase [Gemmataceae bacterium]
MALDTSKPTLQSIGNYDLLEKIAEGGMGAIYKGRHRETGQIVAIKIMPPHMAGNAVLLKRFEQEFRAASRLDHPNIVRALDYGDTGTTPYLVMEFVEGESLGQKIEREGRLPETEAIRLIAQVAQGLHRAHKLGLIHRDVKPDNILVTPDGQAKLADLGLVKEIDADLNLTRTGRGLGTPHFMAPEQFRNAKNADVRCDIYSLGATLYMMVTGELPFRSNGPLDAWMKKMQNELVPPRQIVPTLSDRVDWAIRRAMHRDPEMRPASCREFVEDLTGHSTRKITPLGVENVAQDIWYLVYRDDEGETHTVKGSTAAIRRSLKEGLLGDASNVRASRGKSGPFEPLRSYPEFRDLVVALPQPNLTAASTQVVPTITPVGGLAPPTRKTVAAPTQPQPSAVDTQMPHINLEGAPSRPSYPEWLRTILLIVLLFLVAVTSATLAFVLLK